MPRKSGVYVAIFFGTGECFVFSLKPHFACYKWTHANDLFMVARRDFIGMGGGTAAHYAFYLDSELYFGTSEVSNTFLNRRLSGTEEFRCTVVEVWADSKEKHRKCMLLVPTNRYFVQIKSTLTKISFLGLIIDNLRIA